MPKRASTSGRCAGSHPSREADPPRTRCPPDAMDMMDDGKTLHFELDGASATPKSGDTGATNGAHAPGPERKRQKPEKLMRLCIERNRVVEIQLKLFSTKKKLYRQKNECPNSKTFCNSCLL